MKTIRLFSILFAGVVILFSGILLTSCGKDKNNDPVNYMITVTAEDGGTAQATIGSTAVV